MVTNSDKEAEAMSEESKSKEGRNVEPLPLFPDSPITLNQKGNYTIKHPNKEPNMWEENT